MRRLTEIFRNRPLFVALVAWVAAQVSKVIIILIREKRLRIRRLIGSGDMPSSHASFATALALSIGQTAGYNSPVFALAAAFSLVVMYDAAGVRRQAGNHARVLNQIRDVLEDVLEKGKPLDEKRLHELIGHTPMEVLGGLLVGILIAVLMR